MKNIFKILASQNKFYTLSIVIFTLWLFSQIPYVSLLLSPFIFLFLVYITMLILFHIPTKITGIVALALLLVSFPWVLVGSRIHAEPLGVAGFLLLSITFLQEAWNFRKTNA